MRISLLFCLFACFFAPLSAQHWATAPDSLPDGVLKMSFVSADTGYVIVRNQRIFYTTDQGASWTERFLPAMAGSFPELQDIHFLNPQYGFVASRASTTHLFKTTDGGSTWTDIIPDSTNLGNGTSEVHFPTASLGLYATGSSLYRTTDAGLTWTDTTYTDVYISDIDFSDAQYGFAGFWDGTFAYTGGMLYTNDGGLTWSRTNFPQTYSAIEAISTPFTAVCFALSNRFTMAGNEVLVFRSDNGGLSWDTIVADTFPSFMKATDIVFENLNNGWISTNEEGILFTQTFGNTWFADAAPTGVSYQCLAFAGGVPLCGADRLTLGELWYRSLLDSRTDPAAATLTAYPVPAAAGDVLHLDLRGALEMSLVSLTGQVVSTQVCSPVQETHSLTLPAQLSAGIYLLRVHTEAGVRSARIRVDATR